MEPGGITPWGESPKGLRGWLKFMLRLIMPTRPRR
jgi:hypothetical protein